MKIFSDNSQAIGNTPLVKINHIVNKGATVIAKIEGRNPSYSVKCRIGAGMIWDAEIKGYLTSGSKIIEPTSGNTGIALAYVAASRGYDLTITMPESMSIERRQVMGILGAKIILTPAAEGMAGAIKVAEDMAQDDHSFFMPRQFENPANPDTHYRSTGPEIWNDTDGTVDVIVAGVGTGGTISGIARYLKEKKDICAVAVEPAASPVISQKLAGVPLKPMPHKIQGIGAGFIPATLDLKLIDRVEQVENDEAIEFSRRLAREEGILAGISSGAAMAVASRLAILPEFEGKNMVVILPDASERYLSSALFEHI